MAINKVVYGTTVLVDLTSDTVDAAHLAKGCTAHDAGGNLIVGALEQKTDSNLLSGVTPSLLNGTTQSGKTYVIPAGDVEGTEYLEYQLDIPPLTSDTNYCVFSYGETTGGYRTILAILYYQDTDGTVRHNYVSGMFFSQTPNAKSAVLSLASGVKPLKFVFALGKATYSTNVSNVTLMALDF